MSAPQKYLDFGAPDKFGAHLFRVELPAVRTEPVRIVEAIEGLLRRPKK